MGFCGTCCFQQTWSNNGSLNKVPLSLSLWIPHQVSGENSILFLPSSEVPRPLRPLRWEGQTLSVSGFFSSVPKQRPRDPTDLSWVSCYWHTEGKGSNGNSSKAAFANHNAKMKQMLLSEVSAAETILCCFKRWTSGFNLPCNRCQKTSPLCSAVQGQALPILLIN